MPTDSNFPIPDFAAMTRQLFNNLAPEIATEAQSFFKTSFDKEGFTDSGFIVWPKLKDQALHTLLFKSHALKDSIRIKSQMPERIEIIDGEDLPYAEGCERAIL